MRFNALCVSDGGFNPRRRLKYTQPLYPADNAPPICYDGRSSRKRVATPAFSFASIWRPLYMDIELTPAQIGEFKTALLSAFTRGDMEQVVRFGLETPYSQIVRSGGTTDQEFLDVVEWANKNNKVVALLAEARRKNAGNVRLRNFEANLRSEMPPAAALVAPSLANSASTPAMPPAPSSQLPTQPTILFIAANPVDAENPSSFDAELRNMKDALRRSEFGRRFNIEVELAARIGDLHRIVRENKPTIVHFAGHGETDGIILEDEYTRRGQVVPSDALAEFFSFYASVQCVLFNACYTDELAKAVAQHVPYVIGMRTAANDMGQSGLPRRSTTRSAAPIRTIHSNLLSRRRATRCCAWSGFSTLCSRSSKEVTNRFGRLSLRSQVAVQRKGRLPVHKPARTSPLLTCSLTLGMGSGLGVAPTTTRSSRRSTLTMPDLQVCSPGLVARLQSTKAA